MSFRLRIFMLVIGVAVTAIGATAWLTLSLASRQYENSQRDANRHRTEIIDAVQKFGLLHGAWPGLDVVVADLSQRTGLHIQLRTETGDIVVDSDTIESRVSGVVQAAAVGVDPRPVLPKPGKIDAGIEKKFTTVMPTDLFGPDPTDPVNGSPAAMMVRKVAQYRAALVMVRCVAADDPSQDAALPLAETPYITPAELAGYPACRKQAEAKVLNDSYWLLDIWDQYHNCTRDGEVQPERRPGCLYSTFTYGVTTSSAVPLQLYLGAKPGTDITQLGRPAALGLFGLVVVALVGTALIARRVSRPVARITEASRQLADGRLDVRVPARGTSELARLSASFNAMAEAVQRSEERQRRLVADVAHELRTPLSNLRGYLEGLQDGVVEPSKELFASLHEETLLQRRILDDLQVLALAEAGDLKYTKSPVDLADLAAGGVTAHRAVAAEAGVAFTVDTPAPVIVEADADRLRQVLGNLLTNAIRYTDREGHVLVRVRAHDTEAILTVQDTGVGMTASDLTRVFDRFWRADPARQRATGGTGLGLTIAHRIVTDHGGRIEVTSKPHLGTTFTVHLPLSPP
ncbi:sensor histidine kinase [Winogradskya humida]|uniref:histidine kinase n=1 Tax=Winogradskya humida TaxID=113566 RepID=A0ABQ3ZHY1_9ACTN|nr:ATP-binding protein [Actinoplanes humidus]GIE18175.1 two-component sensor histidine kinase [Actinoplanes humidus]